MASTPTANFAYNKPAEGDIDWDTTTNGNWDLLDADLIAEHNSDGTHSTVTMSGTLTMSDNIDLNGQDLLIDADGDSYLHASGDDVVDLVLAGASGELAININGAEDFQFVANGFNVLSGSHITVADDAWIGLGAAAGRIQFDNQTPDEVNILAANVGIGTETPGTLLELAGAGAELTINATSGNPKLTLEENGTWAYYWVYHITDNNLALATTNADGGGTDAYIWKVPDGQTTIDANTTWDEDVFDYVCDACGWHNLHEPPDATCPDCGGSVEWQDDVALITEAMRQPDNMTLLDKLQAQGVMKRGDEPGRAYISLQEAIKFTWSGLGQMARRIATLEQRLEATA